MNSLGVCYEQLRIWCYFYIPSLNFCHSPLFCGKREKCHKMWGCPHLASRDYWAQHRETDKINFHTKDNRPTLWSRIHKLHLTQCQDSVAHLFVVNSSTELLHICIGHNGQYTISDSQRLRLSCGCSEGMEQFATTDQHRLFVNNIPASNQDLFLVAPLACCETWLK